MMDLMREECHSVRPNTDRADSLRIAGMILNVKMQPFFHRKCSHSSLEKRCFAWHNYTPTGTLSSTTPELASGLSHRLLV